MKYVRYLRILVVCLLAIPFVGTGRSAFGQEPGCGPNLAGRCARSQSTWTYGLLVEVQPLTLRQSPARNPVRGIGEQPEDGGWSNYDRFAWEKYNVAPLPADRVWLPKRYRA
jgi:hypothetical protein